MIFKILWTSLNIQNGGAYSTNVKIFNDFDEVCIEIHGL